MKNNQEYQKQKTAAGIFSLLGGAILFALGLILENSGALADYLKLIQGVGVFLLLWGAFQVVRALLYRKDPAVLKKEMVENLDERNTWIRYRSGNNAFLVAIATTYIVLLVVGMTKESINPDPAWWVLAGIVVLTLLTYIISLLYYEKRY